MFERVAAACMDGHHTRSVVLLCWFSGLFFLGVLHLVMFYLRRSERLVGVFGVLCLAAAGIALFTALVRLPVDAHRLTFLQTFQYAFTCVSISTATDFLSECAGQVRRNWARRTYFVAALACAIACSGAYFDASKVVPRFGGAPLTALGTVSIFAVWGCTSIFLLAIFRMARTSIRAPFMALMLPLLTGVFDIGTRALGHSPLHISVDALAVACMILSAQMLRRMGDLDRDLISRTALLEETNRRLRDAHAELLVAQQRAATGAVSAVVAHEVRNPLAIIRNALSGYEKRGDALYLDIVSEELARLGRLVSDLVQFAQPLKPQASVESIGPLLETAAAHVSRAQGKEGMVSIIGSDEQAFVDRELLPLAIENLIDNALRVSPAGARVEVTVDRVFVPPLRVPFCRVTVSDRGPGMDEPTIRQAFTPFFTTRPDGTGLGLAIVYRIAEAHGGSVSIHSRVGEGASISLLLPTQPRARE